MDTLGRDAQSLSGVLILLLLYAIYSSTIYTDDPTIVASRATEAA